MARKFVVLEGGDGLEEGDVVEEFSKHDYGLKNDHERLTKVKHVNVWKGKYPFSCVPFHRLKLLND